MQTHTHTEIHKFEHFYILYVLFERIYFDIGSAYLWNHILTVCSTSTHILQHSEQFVYVNRRKIIYSNEILSIFHGMMINKRSKLQNVNEHRHTQQQGRRRTHYGDEIYEEKRWKKKRRTKWMQKKEGTNVERDSITFGKWTWPIDLVFLPHVPYC